MRHRWRRLARLEDAADQTEARRVRALSREQVRTELATCERPAALQLLQHLDDRQLEALAAEWPELLALSDAELAALAKADG